MMMGLGALPGPLSLRVGLGDTGTQLWEGSCPSEGDRCWCCARAHLS